MSNNSNNNSSSSNNSNSNSSSSSSSSSSNISSKSKLKEMEEKIILERKKSILVLILRYLVDNNYLESLEKLQQECGLSLTKFDAADNMDLNSILIEYEDYYLVKFSKRPKFYKTTTTTTSNIVSNNSNNSSNEREKVKKLINNTSSSSKGNGSNGKRKDNNSATMQQQQQENNNMISGLKLQPQSTTTILKQQNKQQRLPNNDNNNNNIIGSSSSNSYRSNSNSCNNDDNNIVNNNLNEDEEQEQDEEAANNNKFLLLQKLRQPLPDSILLNQELRDLAEDIRRDIIVENPRVKWSDIAGLETSKQLLKEAIVMPIKYPQYFTGLLSPWRGVLLFGPPGTGKTLLAKAVATECGTTFFNISASSIVSKWRGDSEKLVRILFELARHYAPSTIFIDEIDSIMGKRNAINEHEGSRRMKTELLIQMDGLLASSSSSNSSSYNDRRVFVIGASNLPWDLDSAIIRRLEKRILVDLPDGNSRRIIFQKLLSDRAVVDVNYDMLSQMTEGYSGADIVLVCKEAAMRPVRKLMKKYLIETTDDNNNDNDEQKMTPKESNNGSSSSIKNATTTNNKVNSRYHYNNASKKKQKEEEETDEEKMKDTLDPITMNDFNVALSLTKPSSNIYNEKYSKWYEEFGNSISLAE